jgi:hypothetical protein
VLPDALENVLFSNTQVKLKKHRVGERIHHGNQRGCVLWQWQDS